MIAGPKADWRLLGLRYYFRCPATRRRREVLALIVGRLARRKHFRLAYASDDGFGKVHRRIEKLAAALAKPIRRAVSPLKDRDFATPFTLDGRLADTIGRRLGGFSTGQT